MDDYLLLTAGPVPISEDIRQILNQPMIYHRSAEFIRIFEELSESLQYLFSTEADALILSSSGTGAMEAVITNLFSPDDAVIVVENGKFSERWTKIARNYRLEVDRLTIPWCQSVTEQAIVEKLKQNQAAKAIFLTHCETSTGALTRLETIVPVIRKQTSALVIVDAISSAGVLPLKMDDWGIDVIVTASQKGLGLPPGLAFVALNNRAWIYSELAELPRFYFDLTRARQALRLGNSSPFTPAIPLVFAANEVLKKIKFQGIEALWQERKEIAENFRDNLHKAGLTIFPHFAADSLSVINIEPFINAEKMINTLKNKFNIIVSGGQGSLQNKVIRVGHMVNIAETELNYFLKNFQSICQPVNK